MRHAERRPQRGVPLPWDAVLLGWIFSSICLLLVIQYLSPDGERLRGLKSHDPHVRKVNAPRSSSDTYGAKTAKWRRRSRSIQLSATFNRVSLATAWMSSASYEYPQDGFAVSCGLRARWTIFPAEEESMEVGKNTPI